jgi:hypothetical protein
VTEAAAPPPTPPAAERFRQALNALLWLLSNQLYLGHRSMPRPLHQAISRRLMAIRDRFRAVAERIREGKFKPRRPVTRTKPAEGPSPASPPDPPHAEAAGPADRPPAGSPPPGSPPPGSLPPSAPAASPLPRKRGWLIPLLIPLHDANAHRNAFERLLADPEMQALLAAAPTALGRSIRSLCWMLRLDPPKIVAPPKRPRPPKPSRPKKEKPEPFPPYKPPYHPDMPAWLRDMPINPHLLDPSLYHRKSRRPRKRMA